MARLGYVDHGYDPPAQLEEPAILGLGVLEFLEAHSSPVIGRSDSGDGLAAHGLLSTDSECGPMDTSRGIARLAGGRQTFSSQGWQFNLSFTVVFPAPASRGRVTRKGMLILPS